MLPFLTFGGPSYFTTLFPFWWAAATTPSGREFGGCSSRSSSGSGTPRPRRPSWLTPLGGYSRDDTAGTQDLVRAPVLLLPHSDTESETRVFSPLYIGYRSKPEQATTTRSVTLFYRRERSRGLDHHRSSRCSGTSTTPPPTPPRTRCFPSIFRRQRPRDDHHRRRVFPCGLLPQLHATAAGARGSVPAGLLRRSAEPQPRASSFPLFWHFRRRAREPTTAAAPFFYRHGDRHGTSGAFLPLLYFYGRHARRQLRGPVPAVLALRERARRDQHHDPAARLLPHAASDGWSLGVGPLFPLLFAGSSGETRSHFVLFPLFWHFRDARPIATTTVVGTYMHRRTGGETTDALFPLLYYRRGARPGGQRRDQLHAVPAGPLPPHAQRGVLVTPLGGCGPRPEPQGGLHRPLLLVREPRRSSASGVPLLYVDITRLDTGERTRHVRPLVPDRRARATAPRPVPAVRPLPGRAATRRPGSSHLLPPAHAPTATARHAVPAVLASRWPGNSTTTVVGPWYTAARARRTQHGPRPALLLRPQPRAQPDRHPAAAVLPARPGRRHPRLDLVPLYYRTPRRRQADHHAVPRLLVFGHQAERATRSSSRSTGTSPTKDSHQVHDGRAGLSRRRPGTGRRAASCPSPGSCGTATPATSTNALIPLFYREQRAATGSRCCTARPATGGRPARGSGTSCRRSSAAASEVTWTRRPRSSRRSCSTRARAPTRGLTTCLACSTGAVATSPSSTTLVLPLFYDLHDYRIQRTTVLFPLFVRYQRMSDQNTYWVAPLFYRHTTPTDATHGRLPALLGLQARPGADHRRVPVLRPLEADRPPADLRLPDLLLPRRAQGRRDPRRHLPAIRGAVLRLGGQAPGRLHVGDPGRSGRPRAHRPPPLPAAPLHDLRDRARAARPDLLVQPAGADAAKPPPAA